MRCHAAARGSVSHVSRSPILRAHLLLHLPFLHVSASMRVVSTSAGGWKQVVAYANNRGRDPDKVPTTQECHMESHRPCPLSGQRTRHQHHRRVVRGRTLAERVLYGRDINYIHPSAIHQEQSSSHLPSTYRDYQLTSAFGSSKAMSIHASSGDAAYYRCRSRDAR